MKKNFHYIAEAFDFNEVLDSTNNDEIINNISNTLALDSIINVIKNTFKTSEDYKYSKFDISDDKRVIVVTTTLIYSEYLQLQTRFIISNDNSTIYVDYKDSESVKNSIEITKLISQILRKVKELLKSVVKCKIRIIMPYFRKAHSTYLNKYMSLPVTYYEVCFITSMVKNGYTNISIFNGDITNGLTIDINKDNLQLYDFGNIIISKDFVPINNINNDIITDFINYMQSYMLPDDGYVLFDALPVYNDTADITIYLNKAVLCKFNDKETLSTMQHTKFKITDAEVKLMCKHILYNTVKLTKTIDKLTLKIPLNKLDKFYIRIVLASILSGDIASIMENYKSYTPYYKNKLDSSVLKAYYNYVIDDIRNHGPIYNQIFSYNV